MHILFGKLDLVFYWLIAGVVTVRAFRYITGEMKRYREESGFLAGLDVFLRNVSHMYYEHHSPAEAIRNARYMSEEKSVCREADVILELLESADIEARAGKYFASEAPDSMKKLASLAIDVTETGDRPYGGSTLFLRNLERLTSEACRELRDRKRLHYAFRGMMALCVVPLYLFPFLIRQQTELMTVLADFYSGEWGMLITLGAPVVSLVFLKGVICLKELSIPGRKPRRIDGLAAERRLRWFTDRGSASRWRNSLVNRLKSVGEQCDMRVTKLRQFSCALLTFTVVMAVLMAGNIKTRRAAMSDLSVLNDVGCIYASGEKDILREYIPSFMKEFRHDRESSVASGQENADELRNSLMEKVRNETGIANSLSLSRIADDLEKRMERVSTPLVRLHDLPVAFVFALAGWFAPILGLELTFRIAKTRRELEVSQLQSICLMKMHVPHMTVVKMLTSMELFSVRFRGVISRCLDRLASGDDEALVKMSRETGSVHFSRLADCFRRVDRCGIETAFVEIESQMESFSEDQKIEKENAFEERHMLAGTLAAIPLYYVMSAAIIPYFVAILGMLSSYATELNGYL